MSNEVTPPGCENNGTQNEDTYLTMGELTGEAAALAERVHRGQTRKLGSDKGRDYFVTHLLRVAEMVTLYHPEDYEAIALAWIHDTLEDHPDKISVDELKDRRFPTRVIDGLIAITRNPGEDYLGYLKRCFKNRLARIVKVRDLYDNGDNGGPVKYQLATELFALWKDIEDGSQKVDPVHFPPAAWFVLGPDKAKSVGDYLNQCAKEGDVEND